MPFFIGLMTGLWEDQTVGLRHQTIDLRRWRGAVRAWGICTSVIAIVIVKESPVAHRHRIARNGWSPSIQVCRTAYGRAEALSHARQFVMRVESADPITVRIPNRVGDTRLGI